MHYWNDDWPHWNTLHTAIGEILTYWRKHGLGNMGKEKFGTFRDHIHWSDGTIHSMVYPGYMWIQPRWQWFYYNIDYPIIRPIAYRVGIWYLINRYQRWVYRTGIVRAIEKYPEVVIELTASLDYPELIPEKYK